MEIKVYNFESKEELTSFKVRRNCKSIIDNIKKELENKFNCSIRRVLPTGKIDYLNGTSNIQYVLFGENLPCRLIDYVSMC